jgi:hypothetical protein
MKCQHCDQEASYNITHIEGDVPQIYHLCNDHAHRSGLLEGVQFPPSCPHCGVQMLSGTAWQPSDKSEDRGAKWIKSFYHCPRCGLEDWKA